jgi:hypothetical protein
VSHIDPCDERVEQGALLGSRQDRPPTCQISGPLDYGLALVDIAEIGSDSIEDGRSSWSQALIRLSTRASMSAAGTRQAASDAFGRPRLISDWLT